MSNNGGADAHVQSTVGTRPGTEPAAGAGESTTGNSGVNSTVGPSRTNGNASANTGIKAPESILTGQLKASEPVPVHAQPKAAAFGAPADPSHKLATSATCEADQVLKSGWLFKRGKSKTWSRKWAVLRPNQLALYKDEREYKAVRVVQAGEIMSAAVLDDPQRANHFAVFTPDANLHLRADNHPDAQEWVDILRMAANGASENMLASSYKRDSILGGSSEPPMAAADLARSPQHPQPSSTSQQRPVRPLSPRDARPHPGTISIPPPVARPISPGLAVSPMSGGGIDFSGTEGGMSSNTSERDGAPANSRHQATTSEAAAAAAMQAHPDEQEEKVLKKGHLLRLRKHLGQWKKQWVVVTTHRLVLYKGEQHKHPQRVIDASRILDAIEIDPLSKSKKYCLQVVTPEKRLRFCADSEEDLTTWLAVCKSIIRG